MRATAVIPIKSLANAKRRLSARLWRSERAALVLRLFERELDVLERSPCIERVIVVTSDKRAAELAESKGATVALQPDNGVNAAIQAGIERASDSGAQLIFAIHGDLPLIETSDVAAMLQEGERGGFAIAPDRYRTGTNAIAIRRDVDLTLQFGTRSFQRFLSEARGHPVEPRVVVRPGLALDLDTPADLLEYRRRLRQEGDLGVRVSCQG